MLWAHFKLRKKWRCSLPFSSPGNLDQAVFQPGEWRELANQEIEELKQSLRQKLVKADPNMKVRTDSESISSKESHTHGSKQHSDGEDFEDLSFDDFLSED